jgi:hypothetical protein
MDQCHSICEFSKLESIFNGKLFEQFNFFEEGKFGIWKILTIYLLSNEGA